MPSTFAAIYNDVSHYFRTITNDLTHSLTAGLHPRNFIQLTASQSLKPALVEKYV